jgi:N-acetylglucosaminyldiphosphoundecaprenol N-acetyl-beta-D-mannosaminyltransferase
VHLVSVSHTVDYLENWVDIRDGRCHQVVVTGFHGLMEAHKRPDVRSILNEADLWVPDGIAPVWMARRRGHRSVARAPGAEIMREFLSRANERGYRSFFYGDTEETLSALKDRVSSRYPGHRIVGCYSPPFRTPTPDEEDRIIQEINAARPDVLWVALGMPKQEIWIHERKHQLQVPVAIGVGAAFGFLAGTVSRCPAWVGRAGFEWVYRFLREPKKLWRRDLLDGPRFLFLAGMELLRNDSRIADDSSRP